MVLLSQHYIFICSWYYFLFITKYFLLLKCVRWRVQKYKSIKPSKYLTRLSILFDYILTTFDSIMTFVKFGTNAIVQNHQTNLNITWVCWRVSGTFSTIYIHENFPLWDGNVISLSKCTKYIVYSILWFPLTVSNEIPF